MLQTTQRILNLVNKHVVVIVTYGQCWANVEFDQVVTELQQAGWVFENNVMRTDRGGPQRIDFRIEEEFDNTDLFPDVVEGCTIRSTIPQFYLPTTGFIVDDLIDGL